MKLGSGVFEIQHVIKWVGKIRTYMTWAFSWIFQRINVKDKVLVFLTAKVKWNSDSFWRNNLGKEIETSVYNQIWLRDDSSASDKFPLKFCKFICSKFNRNWVHRNFNRWVNPIFVIFQKSNCLHYSTTTVVFIFR